MMLNVCGPGSLGCREFYFKHQALR